MRLEEWGRDGSPKLFSLLPTLRQKPLPLDRRSVASLVKDGRSGDERHDHGDHHGAVGVGLGVCAAAPGIEDRFEQQVQAQRRDDPN